MNDHLMTFLDLVDKAFKDGYQVTGVEVDQNDDGSMLACAMTEDASPVVALEFPRCDQDELEQALAMVVITAAAANGVRREMIEPVTAYSPADLCKMCHQSALTRKPTGTFLLG